MFEPEYQNMDCPKCLQRRVYSDRAIGFYCMSCGHELTSDEVVTLIQKTTLTWQLTPTASRSQGTPVAEIRELPVRRAREADRVTHRAAGHKEPDG